MVLHFQTIGRDGAWVLRSSISVLLPRWQHAMPSIPSPQRFAVGGQTMQGLLDDTWEWNGTTWTKRDSSVHPPHRFGHAMAYDSGRQKIILFGGQLINGSLLKDTWEWDGRTEPIILWVLRPEAVGAREGPTRL